MRTRRELLTIGGAGVAAMTLPSFFTSPSVALAQGNSDRPDPMFVEIQNQFRRLNAAMAANPLRGNAHQIAATFRMLAAWGKSNNIDAQIRRAVEDAVALDGHQNLVTRLGAYDFEGVARKAGIPLPPNFRNPTDVDFAKAIGAVRAGLSIENEFRLRAFKLERSAQQFNNRMAVLNRQQPETEIRRVQQTSGCQDDIDCDGTPDSIDGTDDRPIEVEGTCNQLPDGSFSCNLVATNMASNPMLAEACSNAAVAMFVMTVVLGFLCLAVPYVCAGAIFTEGLWGWVMWYMGC